jgi:hypothetical protein
MWARLQSQPGPSEDRPRVHRADTSPSMGNAATIDRSVRGLRASCDASDVARTAATRYPRERRERSGGRARDAGSDPWGGRLHWRRCTAGPEPNGAASRWVRLSEATRAAPALNATANSPPRPAVPTAPALRALCAASYRALHLAQHIQTPRPTRPRGLPRLRAASVGPFPPRPLRGETSARDQVSLRSPGQPDRVAQAGPSGAGAWLQSQMAPRLGA